MLFVYQLYLFNDIQLISRNNIAFYCVKVIDFKDYFVELDDFCSYFVEFNIDQ